MKAEEAFILSHRISKVQVQQLQAQADRLGVKRSQLIQSALNHVLLAPSREELLAKIAASS